MDYNKGDKILIETHRGKRVVVFYKQHTMESFIYTELWEPNFLWTTVLKNIIGPYEPLKPIKDLNNLKHKL